MEAKIIDFKALNNHLTDEFKEKFIDIINEQRAAKKIQLNQLCRCLHSLGFEYPIIQVLNKTINLNLIPLEYFFSIMLICGVDIALIMTPASHENRNIKDRKKLAIKRLYAPKYNDKLNLNI